VELVYNSDSLKKVRMETSVMSVLEKNNYYEIDIKSIGEGGEGIGKYEGMTVFVHGGLPGDIAKVKIIKLKKQYAIGKAVEILKASEFRKEASCPYAYKCGGCQVQHMSYEGQLKMKTQIVQDAVERIGKIDKITISDTLGMACPYHYRNKGQYPIRLIDGKVAIGFYRQKSHDLIDIKSCELQKVSNNEILDIVRDFIETYNISVYDENKGKGLIRHLVIRSAKDSNDTMVVLVAQKFEIPNLDVLLERLAKLSHIKSIIVNKNSKKGNRIMGFENKTVFGEDKIVDRIGHLKFNISPLSFFQVNAIQTEVLYNKALEYADLKGDENVMDLYCGIGSISLFLAQKAKKVIGVEIIEDAILDARENARINGIENADFYVGKAEEVVPKLVKEGVTADVVVVDPPRKGCDETLINTLLEIKPKKIVYVSCKASTMARDIRLLVDGGYELVKGQAVDLFPWTTHVEAVCQLSRV